MRAASCRALIKMSRSGVSVTCAGAFRSPVGNAYYTEIPNLDVYAQPAVLAGGVSEASPDRRTVGL
ncbi:MAG: hypothetical protein KC519_18105, partial [Anaerolineae bacterium]|nr:hypothetical protein [Anaerolineae bacterium]